MDGHVVAGRHTIVPDDIDCYVALAFGSFTSIASGLKIVSGQHPAVDAPDCVSNFPFLEHGWGDYPASRHHGQVIVGSDVWIGQDVSILEGVMVGHGATIAARSVVVRDVLPYALVAGNPAKEKKLRFTPWVIERLLGLAWWDWPDERIKAELPHMRSIRTFLRENPRPEEHPCAT